jgi:hypothetical protein
MSLSMICARVGERQPLKESDSKLSSFNKNSAGVGEAPSPVQNNHTPRQMETGSLLFKISLFFFGKFLIFVRGTTNKSR